MIRKDPPKSLLHFIVDQERQPQPGLHQEFGRCEQSLYRLSGEIQVRDMAPAVGTYQVASDLSSQFRSWAEGVLAFLATRRQPMTTAKANFILDVVHGAPDIDRLRYVFYIGKRCEKESISEEVLIEAFAGLYRGLAHCRDGQDAMEWILHCMEYAGLRMMMLEESNDASSLTDVSALIFRIRERCNQVLVEGTGEDHQTVLVTPAESPSTPQMEELMAPIQRLIGLNGVKQSITEMVNLGRVRKMRADHGLPSPPVSMHMVFTGNPGTGKTTVARLVGDIYRRVGLLSNGHLVEVDRAQLVADYVGQTATKTTQVLQSAKGGVLFIDEAYSLSERQSGHDFGPEAVETILKFMEDNRDNFLLIAAGYTGNMERFLDINPGLKSRFGATVRFTDFTAQELVSILRLMAHDANYELTPSAWDRAFRDLNLMYSNRGSHFGNAREVRRYFEGICKAHSNRVARLPDSNIDALRTIEVIDLESKASLV
jgi:hypothetical protein